MANLFKPTSYRSGAALAVGATAVWKVISFVNSLLIAAYFGAGSATDLYFYILIALGLGAYFLQRLNAAVVIPEAMTLEEHTPGRGRALLNGFLYFYVLLLGISVLAALTCPVTVARGLSLFKTAELTAQRTLIVLGIVLFGLQVLASYLTAVLEMYRRFTAALFSPLNALLPLVFLLCFSGPLGVSSLMYGFVLSNVIQIAVFAWVLKTELAWEFTPCLFLSGRTFRRNLASNQLLEFFNIINGLLPLYLLSGLAAGLVSALNYAKQLTESATEVFSLRITNISKIELTERAARNQQQAFNRSYLRTHRFLCFLLTPLAVFSIFYAPEIITVFFKRGLFTQQNVQETTAFLRPLLAVMLLMVPTLMQNNAAAAMRKLKTFLPYSLSGTLLFTLAVPLAMHWGGPFAYPYTQLACILISLVINAVFFKRHLSFVAYTTALRDMGRLVGINLLALLPCIALDTCTTLVNPLLTLACRGIIFVSVLGVISYFSGDLKKFLSYFSLRLPHP